jgi:hypothetical protein
MANPTYHSDSRASPSYVFMPYLFSKLRKSTLRVFYIETRAAFGAKI